MSYEEDSGMEVELTVDAPREPLFEVFSDTSRWRELVTCITGGEVLTDHAQGEGATMHWEVTIAGITVDVWEKIDGHYPPEEFTWTSIEKSSWDHEGAVRFEALDDDRTRVYTYQDYDLPRVVDNRLTRPLFKRGFQREIRRSFENVCEMVEEEYQTA